VTQSSTCRTTCPYCGVGCGVVAEVREEQLIAVSGDSEHPANFGRLCVKGSGLAESQVVDGRLLSPRLHGETVNWDRALDGLSSRLQQTIAEHGPGAVAFYLSGQLLTEDYYVANKLMKGFLGSANVDTNSRLCMSSAVAGYKRAFGADYVPCSYEDLEQCDVLVMVGSNAAWTHPVLYQRIAAAKQRNPDRKVVVIDPRRTATCDLADLHLAIAPGSDGYLFAGLLHYLNAEGLTDSGFIARHTDGFEAAIDHCADMTPARVATATGLELEQLLQFYRYFAQSDRAVTFYSQGVNQSATGTDKCNAIINCHLASGKIGRPGCGPFSITGQPNAMGGREVGGLANQLAAHMDFRDSHRDTVQRFWNAPALAPAEGLKAVDLFEAVERGEIRFLWIMATNPAVSLPDSAQVRRALKRCDFVVVSDCVSDTDTTGFADLLLPAQGWGEKDGTVTNSERCISRQRALVPPMGAARPDWWMVTQVARRLGFEAHFNYQSSRDIFVEHAALSGFENQGQRDFDISALADLDHQAYDELRPTYWPCPKQGTVEGPGRGRFYTDNRRAQFVTGDMSLPDLAGRSNGPLRLNSGRLRDQWHTMTRTGRVARLMQHSEVYSIAMNPLDAEARGVAEGSLVRVSNQCGELRALVKLDDAQLPGQLFSPIHWSDQFSASACVSGLFPAITDPVSGQPQSKYAAVGLERMAVSRWGLLLSRDKPVFQPLPYWSTAAVQGGYLTLLAWAEQPADLARQCQSWLPALRGEVVNYVDAVAQDNRLACIDQGAVQYALFAAGEQQRLPGRRWLGAQLMSEQALDYRILAGREPQGQDSGRMVCSCHEVGELDIIAAIESGQNSVEALGLELRCGTQCGSCLPELRALLRAEVRKQVAA